MVARACRLLTGAVVALVAVAPAAGGAQAIDPAQAVKATYLYKFAPFVEWPESAFASPASPIVVCVVGDDAFARVVGRAAAGERVGGRRIAVRSHSWVTRKSDCHIMYVAEDAAQTVAEALEAVRGLPVLTVTDEVYGNEVGVIHLVVRDRRVRFEIDNQLAHEQRLKMSPKVLELAVRVRQRPG